MKQIAFAYSVLALVSLGIVSSGCSGPVESYRLSWIGVSPFPSGAQASAFARSELGEWEFGCSAFVTSRETMSISEIVRKGTLLGESEKGLADAYTIAIVSSLGSQSMLLSNMTFQDFDGKLYEVSFTQYKRITLATLLVLQQNGCDGLEQTIQSLQYE